MGEHIPNCVCPTCFAAKQQSPDSREARAAVTQVDREAAADLAVRLAAIAPIDGNDEASIRAGIWDEESADLGFIVQAFALPRLAAAEQQRIVPGEGMVLVPRVATRAMKRAGGLAFNPDEDVTVVTSFEAGQAWSAMIDAALSPDTAQTKALQTDEVGK